MNKFNYIANLFTDEKYPIWVFKDNVYKTDCYTSIQILKSNFDKIPKNDLKEISMSKTVSMFDLGDDIQGRIKTDKLFEVLSVGKVHYDKLKCIRCDGFGEVECCECGYERGCQYCDEEGVTNEIYPYSAIGIKGSEIVIKKHMYDVNFINRVAMSAAILGSAELSFKISEEKGYICFNLGFGVKIVGMKINMEMYDDYIVIV